MGGVEVNFGEENQEARGVLKQGEVAFGEVELGLVWQSEEGRYREVGWSQARRDGVDTSVSTR